jgi:hypothetical protein
MGNPALGASQALLPMSPALTIPLLTAAGLAGFWLFRWSINFFDNI